MEDKIAESLTGLIQSAGHQPAVTIILPFEPVMNSRMQLEHALENAVKKVEKMIVGNYAADACVIVLQRLQSLIETINYNSPRKSIAIYISPLFEKILYLEVPLEERVEVGDSFHIRDVIYARKQEQKYLVLLLSARESQILLGNNHSLIKIVADPIRHASQYVNDIPEKVGNFSDSTSRKEVLMDKFLHHIDKALDIILDNYPLPLFVMGTDRITGHFKQLTHHGKIAVAYIHGNYEEAGVEELMKVLQPYIADWKALKMRDLVNRLDEAKGNRRLATGMREVWQEAMSNKGQLLVVEKGFTFQFDDGRHTSAIKWPGSNRISYIHDAVDQVIERTLESGGDVEFVDDGLLGDYDHIALVEYYP